MNAGGGNFSVTVQEQIIAKEKEDIELELKDLSQMSCN